MLNHVHVSDGTNEQSEQNISKN